MFPAAPRTGGPRACTIDSTRWVGKEGRVAIDVNGIAHVQLTVNDPARCVPFWERLCHFLGMTTLVRNEDTVYCIGGRTGVLVRGAPRGRDGGPFHQDRAGLHHFCF